MLRSFNDRLFFRHHGLKILTVHGGSMLSLVRPRHLVLLILGSAGPVGQGALDYVIFLAHLPRSDATFLNENAFKCLINLHMHIN